MTLIELDKPATEPVSVPQAKAWARIERGDEDALIADLVRAARESVERETGLVLAARAFRRIVDPVPPDGRVAPTRGPVLRVIEVRAYGEAGNETIAAPDAVAVEAHEFVLAPHLRSFAVVEIDFEVLPKSVPEGLVQAMLRIVAASYETRGLVGGAMQPALVPPFAKALIAPFRPVRL